MGPVPSTTARIDLTFDPDLRFGQPVFAAIGARLDALRRGRPHLSRQDFQPEDLHPFLPHVVLADVLDGPGGFDYRFRLIGTEVTRGFGSDNTGQKLSEMGTRSAARGWAMADWTVSNRRPVRAVAEVHIVEDRLTLEALFVPLLDGGDRVSHVLAFLVFTPDPDNIRHPSAFQEALRE